MVHSEESLREFGRGIQRLIDGQDLSRAECCRMFEEVLLGRQPDLHQGAFLAALRAKGETAQEIAGAWQAIVTHDTAAVAEDLAEPLVENSGTGMDQLKTFNISSAAAVVSAAGGARLARHGSRALTSACGTVDLLEAVGIDVECDVATVAHSIREVGIGLFNGMSPKVHPRCLARILSRIRFGSTLNIAASLASPCRPTHALRGVYSADAIAGVCRVMQDIGYRRGLVVHGYDRTAAAGMDELSTIGESVVREFFPDGTQSDYRLAPEDVGLKRADFAAIAATGDVHQEALRFLKVVAGTGSRACIDAVCLNAGAILYLVGRADSIGDGVALGRDLVQSGAALHKLCRWVAVQSDAQKNGVRRFEHLARATGLTAAVRAGL